MTGSLSPSAKKDLYKNVALEIAAVLEGENNVTARMATVSNILHHAFDYYFWTGFYVVDPEREKELVIGPYQGTLGCLRIAFGKGVCGTAAEQRQTVIVDDVQAFPGHIACDARSQSEIVAPVFDKDGALIAVLDVDSDQTAMFDDTDRQGLEHILHASFSEA